MDHSLELPDLGILAAVAFVQVVEGRSFSQWGVKVEERVRLGDDAQISNECELAARRWNIRS